METFETGATRDNSTDKFDYEGFLSPLALERYASYMHEHRHQADGVLRDSDNWQKGIPLPNYMKSMLRHVHQLWVLHRGYKVKDEKGKEVTLEDALCAILFNAFGYLHEVLKRKSTHGRRSSKSKKDN